MLPRLTISLALAAMVAVMAFLTPSFLTGRLFVSDAPYPSDLEDVVDSARGAVHEELEGFFGVRVADVRPTDLWVTIAFEVLGFFAPVTNVTATSDRPRSDSDVRWRIEIPSVDGIAPADGE